MTKMATSTRKRKKSYRKRSGAVKDTSRSEGLDEPIGAAIIAARQLRGLTQLDIAGALGVTQQAVLKYEKNQTAVLSTRIPRLCAILGIDPNTLFRWGERVDRADRAPELSKAAISVGVAIDSLPASLAKEAAGIVDLIRCLHEKAINVPSKG